MNKPLITQPWHSLYIEYLADPFDDRTEKQWAEDMQIGYSTIYAWKKDKRNEIYIEAERRRKGFLAEIRNKNWKNLIGQSKKNVKAVELAFKLLGDLVEKTETTHNFLQTDEKKARIAELLAKAKAKEQAVEKFKAENGSTGVPEAGTSGE